MEKSCKSSHTFLMKRSESIQQIRNTEEWDILIIGGGATGLGCAVDAASRGYKTILLEQHDFAKGTSSRATKLAHGGVRYLAQGNIRLVKEALKERGHLLKNAPHVCNTLAFVVPFYNHLQKWYYWCGLWLYDFLSGKRSLGKTKFLSRAGTLRNLPGLNDKNLTGGVLYFDGQFDDSRLAINLAQTAANYGACIINYVAVTGFQKTNKKITAVTAADTINNESLMLRARVVINATGVFADRLLQMAEGNVAATITPSQGIHLVTDKKFFEGHAGLMVPKTDDGRVLFAIPWYDKLLLGTTDTPVNNISTEPVALQEEIDFVIRHFNRYAAATIGGDNIQSVFAGLRPLAASGNKNKTAVMPRDHHIELLASGLVHVTGGKWTTYRSMAEHAIDKAIEAAGLKFIPCRTHNLSIHGAMAVTEKAHFSVYGKDAAGIRQLIQEDISLAQTIHPQYPYTLAEVKWFVQHEMALTVEDILARRTRLLFLDAPAAIDAAPGVARLMCTLLQQPENWMTEQVAAFTEIAKKYCINISPSQNCL